MKCRNWVSCQPIALSRFCLVLVVSIFIANFAARSRAIANESMAEICANTLRQFVQKLDEVLIENPASVLVVKGVLKRYLPIDGCNVGDVISISKKSKFFADAYEQYASYTISFRSKRFVVLFGLQKDTGNIELPAAMVILPRANEKRTGLNPRKGDNG